MGKIVNLTDSDIPKIWQAIRALQNATPMNNSSIGRAGMEVYDQGTINISDGNLIVNGTATISGVLNADGTVTLSGTVGITGPLTISGNTSITGNVISTGTFTNNGPTHLNGATDINGNLDVDGTLNINGASMLNNTLTVAAGKKVIVGGLTLENTGTGGGQVNFPGGSITASSALGMLINHGTVEIAGTTVKISGLPTTALKANLYADSNGRLYRSTAA